MPARNRGIRYAVQPPLAGFFAPLVNLIPMYEHHLHRLPAWFDGIDGFDDVVRATGSTVTDHVMAMLLSMREWIILIDPAQPTVPLVRDAMLVFTAAAQAGHSARRLGLAEPAQQRRPPDEVRA